MMNWVRNNKLTAVLVLIVGYFLFRNLLGGIFGVSRDLSYNRSYAPATAEITLDSAGGFGRISPPSFEGVADVAPDERLVIQNSNLSLLVSDVRETGDSIVKYAESMGGFMVNSSYNRPEGSAYGTITVRIPSTDLQKSLEFLRGLAIKVTNENLQGRDVTAQYVDIEARLATLQKTKSKFEEILDSATQVSDILTVNQNIINIQNQIDNLVGQREALEKNAKLTKITVYLSTDELSLPYTPDKKFRPGVIFKLATRSMLGSLNTVGSWAIWLVVYSVIWVPALVIFMGIKKYLRNKKIS